MSEEIVNQKAFKKKMDVDGVCDLQTALNVLALYQSYRSGDCALGLYQLGLSPSLLTAAIHYILLHHHAADPIYRCIRCSYYNNATQICTAPHPCTFEEINHEV